MNENSVLDTDFDGVFRFTNPDTEDFTALWNNKEYVFPARKRVPLIIPGEPPENVQEIRKRFAYRLAEKMWFKSDEYKRLNAMENYRGGRDDKVLEPIIQMCLDELPEDRAKVRELPVKEVHTSKYTKAVGEDDNLNAAFAKETSEGELQKVGKMPDRAI